ncbi:MAG TPA: Gfo/Idh/MocA family oxidoreductase [Terriglobales bacterium]|jgi:predicted dehydrogenase|nr:Gfo/Idh/MocA family oxidoreductase [Terriglobales bacterium]
MTQRKIRLGIAGMGYVGRIHYEAAKKTPGVEVVAIASRQASRVKKRFPEVAFTSSYQRLFHSYQLDAVLICVPTFLHEDLVVEAAQCGLHVLCEKPMALNAASAARMLRATESSGVVFMVAQLLRFWPQYTAIKKLLTEGKLGRLHSTATYRLAKPPMWSTWFRDPEKSGGCLLDLQIHDMDFIYWMLGRPKILQTFAVKSGSAPKDHVNTVLTFADDQIATIEASYLMPDSWPFSCGLRLTGSQAAAEYRFVSADDIAGRAESIESAHLYAEHGDASEIQTSPQDMFVAQLQHFVDCVRDRRKKLICPPQQSYEVMKLMDASSVSAASGTPIFLEL